MNDQTKSIRNILMLLCSIAVFTVLRILSNLFVPLALAGMLTLIDLPLISFLERRRFPRVLVTFFVAALTIVLLWILIKVIGGTVEQILRDQEILVMQFNRRINGAFEWIGKTIPGVNTEDAREEMGRIISPETLTPIIASLLGSVVGGFGSSVFLFLLYYFILLSGASGYNAYIEYVTGTNPNEKIRDVWKLTQNSISTYMGIKTLVSLLTGALTGIACGLFGLQFALFWGFLAFLMNYIPSIGSIISTLMPVFIGIVQFETLGTIVALAITLGAIQFIIGSVIDPMLMGTHLRLNAATVIFGLLFWNYIWGIPGMLLSVPLMVLIRLILERHDDFAILARVMSNSRQVKRRRLSLYDWLLSFKKDVQ